MDPLFVLYLVLLTVLLVPAKKWAAMNPRRIEDGPSWPIAALSAGYTMVLFVLAMAFEAQHHTKTAALFGAFAFGSAIGACFLTQFKPDPKRVPNPILRWWMGILDSFADGAFKSLIVVPVGALVSLVTPFDGRYWAAAALAVVLVSAKTGIAIHARQTETDHKLYLAQQRMLINSSVPLTAILGVGCLICWLISARPITLSWQAFTSHDYLSIAGFFLGVGLHIR